MHRFFLPEDCVADDTVSIPSGLTHRLLRVLRLGPGDRILVLDNSGWEYEVDLRSAGTGKLDGVVSGKARAAGEPGTKITVYQSLLKGRNLERVLQKCTEVGVTGFVPIVCERCVALDPASTKTNRWGSIILEAAQQSRRGKLPVLHDLRVVLGGRFRRR